MTNTCTAVLQTVVSAVCSCGGIRYISVWVNKFEILRSTWQRK